ncbi:acetyltransferase [Candidatus Aquiluna sp. IMCC13023]|uniref:GNAT family N-acetyltransferase n=1 Tax=Candidatus Aquiluna sp. IMCC13023 TaxID=1081644 RepID=UPI00025B2FD3|nr:GNAT family protein [Candidatus Aquiluna sp. IMCC13023]EIC92099.1 acetyltransferase [Candidatus Aquiluna sp. IMCC13023]
MLLNSMPHANGAPIGIEVGQAAKPALPDTGIALSGSLCRLETLSAESHAQDLFEAFSLDVSDSLWTYLPQGPFQSADEFLSWVQHVQGQQDPAFYAIIDEQTNKAVGVSAYLRIDQRASSIEIGWLTFSPLMQKKPIATEAMYLMMKNTFDLGYRRLEWKCNALNAPSIRAAARLGMSFEGVFRQAAIVKGHSRDTAWFSILDSEWPQVRSAIEAWLAEDNFYEAGNQRLRLSEVTLTLLADSWPQVTVRVSEQN